MHIPATIEIHTLPRDRFDGLDGVVFPSYSAMHKPLEVMVTCGERKVKLMCRGELHMHVPGTTEIHTLPRDRFDGHDYVKKKKRWS